MKQTIRMNDGSFRDVHRVSIGRSIYNTNAYYVNVSYWIPGVQGEVINHTSLGQFDTYEKAKEFMSQIENNFCVNNSKVLQN